LWGNREAKYATLFETVLETTKWTEVKATAPFFFFVPRKSGERQAAEYGNAVSLPDLMPFHNSGIQTKQDALTVQFSETEIKEVIRDLKQLSLSETREKYGVGPDGRDWQLGWAVADVAKEKNGEFVKVAYRPFDSRWTYYTGNAKGFIAYPRDSLSRLFLDGHNLGLCTLRQTVDDAFRHVVAVREPNEANILISHHVSQQTFPLYLSAGESTGLEFPVGKHPRQNRRVANFNLGVVAGLEKPLSLSFVADGKGDLKKTFGPEDVFNYIYAVFHSPTYRTRYAEFLKSDFPRVPLTSDLKQFRVLCGLGAELVALHLLESPKLGKPTARYPVTGPNIVEKGFPKYLAPGEPEPGTGKPLKEGRVYVSRSAAVPAATVAAMSPSPTGGQRPPLQAQYFEGVPLEVWNFHIGGYQVCEKWLKDRRGRTLTYDDLEHYRKVVTALSETIRLMAEIDAAIPKWPIE
jgi:hypothetical protein